MPKYDMKTLKSVQKDYCEFCGSPASGWPHHIKTRGAGGRETPVNLIQLCGRCHRLVHDGKIKRRQLIEIVARRENIPVKEIYGKLGWIIDDKMPQEIEIENSVLAGKSFEEVIELYLFCLEQGENSLWDRAAIVTALYETGLTPRQIASSVGCSASLCRKFIRTFNAFPLPEDRINILSFRHHVIAAYTDDPLKWVAMAADNQWSTREMQERINSVTDEERELSKAEKALRMAREVIGGKTEVSEWFAEELKNLLNAAS